jgi:hypothetical protein
VHHESKTTAKAVVLDIQPDVMVGVRRATAVDLVVDPMHVATVAVTLTPHFPRRKPGCYGWRMLYTDHTSASQTMSDLGQYAFCGALGFRIPFL